jgi:transposase
MRGDRQRQATMLLGKTPDDLVPQQHPIRAIKAIVDRVLTELSPVFDEMYKKGRGRPSVPPEHLLMATLLMALYSIRSERQFCERLQYDLLFKWFLGLNIDDAAFHPTTFTHNRTRFLTHDVAGAFLGAVIREAQSRKLISEDHFTADGTLLQAWASIKSYRPKDEEPRDGSGGRNPDVDFKGERRSRDTHASTTDPEALLFKKAASEAARLCFAGHLLTENRHGLVIDALLTQATGGAEREALVTMLDRQNGRAKGATLGADKAYDTAAMIAALGDRDVVPHIAQNTSGRSSAVRDEIAQSAGYATSQRRRKLVEEVFGWMKTIGGLRKLRYIGLTKNQLCLTFAAALYNIVRMVSLSAAGIGIADGA